MPLTITQINQELATIVAALTEANNSRDKGITIDLTPVTLQATALCEHILTLSPDDALQILPQLQSTVDQLNALHASMKAS